MKKYLILILGLGILIAAMRLVIIPLVLEVVKSPAFLVETKDEGNPLRNVSTPLTKLAFTHCNTYIKNELGQDANISFPTEPLKSWSVGNYRYIVNAEFTNPNSNPPQHKYTCDITYKNGDDQEGVNDFDNWSIDGLSGL
jgi:hypothetical protein